MGFLLGLALDNFVFTGKVIEEIPKSYTYTRAICDNNECIDILIECFNGEVKSLKPVSELVKFDKSWEDFRQEEEFCE